MSVGSIVTSGPFLLAIPIAAAAGAVTFLSPCCLPLVPGYLSYMSGMTAAGVQESKGFEAVQRSNRGRTFAGAALFVFGFSALFSSYGIVFGELGSVLAAHQQLLIRLFGGVTILLGIMLTGAFERLAIAGRIAKPSYRPCAPNS